ncbi:hypothetical protein C477_22530 [Haloterrigena salina JCM 13891]|uniref:Uncharacterized protein n=1 Tax=Haloterrigena salina JCM 13891 TaxID=1227488 RepID=M0BQR6_9EURY|nr:hypothetical protein [Haloterrigena salina]ELZ13280.1 hypothetical protein C477_22530 [Haloterrigena salina JCM 13891]
MIGNPGTMQALSIELEDETVDALEAERELFGFESRQAYVRWIVEHRGSIDAGAGPDRDRKRDRLLADHRERITRLEERVATLAQAVESDRADGESRAADDSAAKTADESAERTPDGDETEPADRDRHPDGTPVNREPVLEVHGSPRTVRQGPDSSVSTESTDSTARAEPADGEGDPSPTTSETTETESTGEKPSGLSPERVARIREDPVHEDAGVLGSVETERLDELSRRAVATTRKRLNRDVQTGLEYTSSTRLAGDGVRPGEDITELDELSIPGRSAETIEKRRRAVGRALAYLRDEDEARRSDFVDALYGECPAGYDTSDGWWRCIKTGLRQVDAVDGGEGARVWRYRG